MKQGLLSILVFTGIWGALWDTPEADLSLARLHITSPAGTIQNPPRFLVNVSGITTLTSLYLEDTTSERTSSLPIIKGYPEAQVSARFGRFELGLSGEQTLDGGGKIWEQDPLGISMSLDIYRFSAEVVWCPSQGMGLVLGYNHYLGQLSWNGIDSTEYLDSTHYEALGHTPGFSAGFFSAPTDRLQMDVLVLATTPLLYFEGYESSNNENRDATLSLPFATIGDVHITATDKFDLFLTIRYTFNSMSRFLYIESREDSIIDSLDFADFGVPLYDKNTVIVQVGAGYRIIPPLNLRLWGKYSSSPVDDMRLPWPNPGGISVAAEAIWKQGTWRFAAEIGTRRFHPILSETGTRLKGNSYHLRVGLGLAI